ncbi:MAG TPA: YciI family protein [Gemmatimonadaceae bacterium]|nr:YciI family protein [Gemmatimonadaceae bacterium]
MSDFVFLYRSSESSARKAMGTPEQARRSLDAYLAWIRGLEAGGHLKGAGLPLERTGRVVGASGDLVMDGPFLEAKDIILGFIVVEAADLDEAATLAASCPIVLGGGSVEVRPVAALEA